MQIRKIRITHNLFKRIAAGLLTVGILSTSLGNSYTATVAIAAENEQTDDTVAFGDYTIVVDKNGNVVSIENGDNSYSNDVSSNSSSQSEPTVDEENDNYGPSPNKDPYDDFGENDGHYVGDYDDYDYNDESSDDENSDNSDDTDFSNSETSEPNESDDNNDSTSSTQSTTSDENVGSTNSDTSSQTDETNSDESNDTSTDNSTSSDTTSNDDTSSSTESSSSDESTSSSSSDNSSVTDENSSTTSSTSSDTTSSSSSSSTETSAPTEPTEEIILFDHYYSLIDETVVQTPILIVKTDNPEIFTITTTVISNYDDVYMLGFDSVETTRYAYSYYVDKVDYISDLSDAIVLASDNENSENSSSIDVSTENTSAETTSSENSSTETNSSNTSSSENNSSDTSNYTAEFIRPISIDEIPFDGTIIDLNVVTSVYRDYSSYIALIDTGADNADVRLSVFDDDGKDSNGHGNQMYEYIKEENPNAKILSIKAFEDRTTNAANLYAAIKLAIESNVSIISLSLAGYDVEKNAIIKEAIQAALNNGIIVIGAAGNYAMSAKKFIPGCIDGVITVGAINPDKTRYKSSNYDADIYVVATSTSEATARYTGMYSADNFDEMRVTDELSSTTPTDPDITDPDTEEGGKYPTGSHNDKLTA